MFQSKGNENLKSYQKMSNQDYAVHRLFMMLQIHQKMMLLKIMMILQGVFSTLINKILKTVYKASTEIKSMCSKDEERKVIKMARPRKPIEELTGKRSIEHWEERMEQDEIYQAQFSDEVQALTTREMQQIGKFGEKLFPQFKKLLESRKLYNNTADRMALISLLTYLRTKDELLSYLNCSGIDDTLNYIKSLN